MDHMNTTVAPRVTLRKAARLLGVRDQAAALEILRFADADVRRNYLGDLTVAEADLLEVVDAHRSALASIA